MCPAILDVETFEKDQVLIEKGKHKNAKEKVITTYYLSGKLFCDCCCSAMDGVSGTFKNG